MSLSRKKRSHSRSPTHRQQRSRNPCRRTADEFVYVYMNILINYKEDTGDLKHDSHGDRTSEKDFLEGSHQHRSVVLWIIYA